MATLAQYRSRVAAKLGLDTTAGGADEVLTDGWVNEGITDFLLQTSCKVTSATMNLAAGTADYTLDTGILLVKDLYLSSGGSTYGLTEVTVPQMIELRRSTSTTNSPSLYYAVAGGNLFMVYPTPSAADVITLYYVPRPVTLSTAGASPDEIPVEFHKAVEFYALAEGADYDDDQTSAQGQRYRELYDMWVFKARKSLNRKGNVRLPKIMVGPAYPGRLSRSQDTSPW
jgi:hypothetical protein